MTFELQFYGATGEVTGSLYVIRAGAHTVLLECGLIQGGAENEERNRDPFPVAIEAIDAVILSHAHIDHSGRVPLLVRRGYQGPVYVQNATRDLCAIMLPDSGYLNEKDAEWENRKRRGTDKPLVTPLYTREDAETCIGQFESAPYGEDVDVVPGLTLRFHDAGHILGAAIVELEYADALGSRKLVFSGDLGYRDAPVMNPPATFKHADVVLMESTYGDRLHRSIADTMQELTDVFESARAGQGNILIPAFTVGRTQDLMYLMAENYRRWNLRDWHIFLDSPMAIEATEVYARYRHLYGAKLFGPGSNLPNLPNFHATRTPEESMAINEIASGAIIIAGSGMCSGGRILHHLKNNIWRPECHLLIVGFQAIGTLGRRIVDGAETVKLWGDEYRVRNQVHTIGGLSAHGDQADLVNWYREFSNKPPLYLVHGEHDAQKVLAERLQRELSAPVTIASRAQKIEV
ncbi:MAG: MBL fold metallo-hydrolase [Gammaproteobacteria bacterium]|nr:MBL fold metallo-hydrolase [Gammaproteobacteria bacterium]